MTVAKRLQWLNDAQQQIAVKAEAYDNKACTLKHHVSGGSMTFAIRLNFFRVNPDSGLYENMRDEPFTYQHAQMLSNAEYTAGRQSQERLKLRAKPEFAFDQQKIKFEGVPLNGDTTIEQVTDWLKRNGYTGIIEQRNTIEF